MLELPAPAAERPSPTTVDTTTTNPGKVRRYINMTLETEHNKDFKGLLDYQAELKDFWRTNLRITRSPVLCEKCNVIQNIKKEIYLAKAKRSLGILGALLE